MAAYSKWLVIHTSLRPLFLFSIICAMQGRVRIGLACVLRVRTSDRPVKIEELRASLLCDITTRSSTMSRSHSTTAQHLERERISKLNKITALFSDANIRNFAPVARIMKQALPDNAKIAKEAKECMQECVSEFISFITSEGETPPQG